MSERYGVEVETWRKWTFHKLWVYVSGAYDPGTVKRFAPGKDLEAFAIGAQRKYECAQFVAMMLGEEVPESEKMGQSYLVVGKKSGARASLQVAKG